MVFKATREKCVCLAAVFCTRRWTGREQSLSKSPKICRICTCFAVAPLWTRNCTLRLQGEPAVRITIKGLLIFCSLIAGLIMAEVVAATNQNDSASSAAVGVNN